MTRAAAIVALLGAGVLTACAPLTVAQAERVCLDDALLAQRPRGEVAVGVGTSTRGGVSPVGRVELSVSSDYLMGRDPSAVFASCVQRRSGELPSRPLYEQPGWRG